MFGQRFRICEALALLAENADVTFLQSIVPVQLHVDEHQHSTVSLGRAEKYSPAALEGIVVMPFGRKCFVASFSFLVVSGL